MLRAKPIKQLQSMLRSYGLPEREVRGGPRSALVDRLVALSRANHGKRFVRPEKTSDEGTKANASRKAKHYVPPKLQRWREEMERKKADPGRKITARLVRQLVRWVDSLHVVPRVADLGEACRTGLLLCRVLEHLHPPARPMLMGLFERACTHKTCVINIEKALAVVWKLRVPTEDVPTAEEIYSGRSKKVPRLMRDLFEELVLKQVQARAPTVLRWIQRVAGLYGVPFDAADDPRALERGLAPLRDDLRGGVPLLCVLHYYYGEDPATRSIAHVPLRRAYWAAPDPDAQAHNHVILFHALREADARTGAGGFGVLLDEPEFPDRCLSGFLLAQLDAMYEALHSRGSALPGPVLPGDAALRGPHLVELPDGSLVVQDAVFQDRGDYELVERFDLPLEERSDVGGGEEEVEVPGQHLALPAPEAAPEEEVAAAAAAARNVDDASLEELERQERELREMLQNLRTDDGGAGASKGRAGLGAISSRVPMPARAPPRPAATGANGSAGGGAGSGRRRRPMGAAGSSQRRGSYFGMSSQSRNSLPNAGFASDPVPGGRAPVGGGGHDESEALRGREEELLAQLRELQEQQELARQAQLAAGTGSAGEGEREGEEPSGSSVEEKHGGEWDSSALESADDADAAAASAAAAASGAVSSSALVTSPPPGTTSTMMAAIQEQERRLFELEDMRPRHFARKAVMLGHAPPSGPRANQRRPEAVWRSVGAGDGRVYYYHVDTMETTWERPADSVLMTEEEERLYDEEFEEESEEEEEEGESEAEEQGKGQESEESAAAALSQPRPVWLSVRGRESQFVFSVIRVSDAARYVLKWSPPSSPGALEGLVALPDVRGVSRSRDADVATVQLNALNPQAIRNAGGTPELVLRFGGEAERDAFVARLAVLVEAARA